MARLTRRRTGGCAGIARNAHPRLRLVEITSDPTPPRDPQPPHNPYAVRPPRGVVSNPFYAYRQFVRRMRHAAA